ncbi:hypothetical protein P171DRAFT_254370 [Karstenula rhodostoma CBS 690.94]|uniref:Uncharacterized protein n=1 Tax=Karstenula rhodostoma CBS 690.94 TaxID=1392251 RepID=A0A9P4PNM4_9PLEO|nr:hypothetical protein P171DRAFT_254370 [Karstenula rhodostoma CBS 690.94]
MKHLSGLLTVGSSVFGYQTSHIWASPSHMRAASRRISACCTRDATQGSAWSGILQDLKSILAITSRSAWTYSRTPAPIRLRHTSATSTNTHWPLLLDYSSTLLLLAACSKTHGGAFRQASPSPIRLTRLHNNNHSKEELSLHPATPPTPTPPPSNATRTPGFTVAHPYS